MQLHIPSKRNEVSGPPALTGTPTVRTEDRNIIPSPSHHSTDTVVSCARVQLRVCTFRSRRIQFRIYSANNDLGSMSFKLLPHRHSHTCSRTSVCNGSVLCAVLYNTTKLVISDTDSLVVLLINFHTKCSNSHQICDAGL